MRPTSIVLFERLFLLSLAIALVNGFLQYDALVAQVGNDPALAQLGWGSGAILVVMAISLLIPLLLWYFIARRASNIAKWILVVMTLLGLLFVNLDPGQLGSLAGIASLAVVAIYPFMKRFTDWPQFGLGLAFSWGALMGWAAVRGEVDPMGWTLFAILFFWQVPHFMAIAWMYREDYEKAGFVMMPSVNGGGPRTGRQAISHTVLLVIASLMPFIMRLAGPAYMLGAVLLGLLFLVAAVRFSRDLSMVNARRLFFASIIYLPLLLGLMVVDKLKIGG